MDSAIRFVQPVNMYAQNQFHYQWLANPGFYGAIDATNYHNQFQHTTGYGYQSFHNYSHQNQFKLSTNGHQSNYSYPYFCEYPQNYFHFDENYFDDSHQVSNNKRAREWYNDDDDYNAAKKQRLTGSSAVTYAFKKSSQYPQPMKKVLDYLFESEITADGWEKINGQYRYHTTIRGKSYCQFGTSIENARERAAETALKELESFKFEQISWPHRLLPFRLEQPFADAIEIMVKNKFDDLMQNDLQYKTQKVRSGIVMTSGMSVDDAKVVAIGTGTKCFSDIREDKNGTILHDMHAEVLARRNFVRFLYDQLIAMVDKKASIFCLDGEEIRLKADLKFHLYVNTIPCGDARVFSLKGCAKLKKMAKQGALRTKKIGGTDIISESNSGRVKSMSCSDKIARWNILGLQGSALAKFIKPIYLESIVLGSTYVPIHLHRGIFGRLENAISELDLSDGYRLNKPKFESTFVMEVMNFAASEDYGVCWSDGYQPEILNLNTGMENSGKESKLSKASFMHMFQSVNRKLPNQSDDGIEKYNRTKEIFYAALENKNFGVWGKKM